MPKNLRHKTTFLSAYLTQIKDAMPYQTFSQQVASHLDFLRANGLNVEALTIDAGFIRCHAFNENQGRGEYVYKTQKNPMNKPGVVGLVTWCRVPGGSQLKHSTYGQDGEIENCVQARPIEGKPLKATLHEVVESKAHYLWDLAKENGRSEYLERKGVGAYGIRFLQNTYGRVAVIPAMDGGTALRTLQFLNPDGSKRFLKGSAVEGLFHKLGEFVDGKDIGLAESYVTAATCLELSGLPVVCVFSSANLLAVAKSLCGKYPASRLIIFADNDRHLEVEGLPNQGLLKACQVLETCKGKIILAVPDFGDCAPSKDASDWNDLLRLKGKQEARRQISQFVV